MNWHWSSGMVGGRWGWEECVGKGVGVYLRTSVGRLRERMYNIWRESISVKVRKRTCTFCTEDRQMGKLRAADYLVMTNWSRKQFKVLWLFNKGHYLKAKLSILIEINVRFCPKTPVHKKCVLRTVPSTGYVWHSGSPRSPQGALAPGLTHTNINKPGLRRNKGHLVHQNTICHGNLDYEVSFGIPRRGQGCVSEPSEGCKCVGICVSGECVSAQRGSFSFFDPWQGKGLTHPVCSDLFKQSETVMMQIWPKCALSSDLAFEVVGYVQ